MNTFKKIALTVSALALTSLSSSAALLLTFTEEGGNVVMRTSGSVDLTGAWVGDYTRTGSGGNGHVGWQGIKTTDIAETPGEYYSGTDLLTAAWPIGALSENYHYNPIVTGDDIYIQNGTVWNLTPDEINIDGLAPNPATYAPETTMTFVGASFTSLGMTHHATNTAIGLWQNDSVAGEAGQIQFSVGEVAAVPEPSSTALLGLGSLALILRRRR